ncbi:hypothetical protein [Nonlabens dokdonensis]|uniref:Lipoprotein n=1 Tax=Nonlabens dokdonensis (strain DSM 17205 / KCTC 12402 / DSW-6) TaxID=592029 RepID=L7W2A3_NONDD|nr:hypothetical protein [Nonlabens dokdonensis]AGC75635.1 hypothetical protein DDD_0508 [Nonlabens dokdonensis DSW-6]
MKNYIFIIGLFLIISCKSDDDISEPAIQTGPIAFTTISQEVLSGDEGVVQSNLVINNASDWIALMNQMDSQNIISRFTETNIDFNNYTVVAMFLDVRGNVWSITITDIMENQNDITVSSEEFGGYFLQESQGFHIVKIPKTTKPFVFL